MKQIAVEKLMELYIDTLKKMGLFLLSEDDKMVGYYVFEEFDVGATTFLHKVCLERLRDAGLISAEIMIKSSKLREAFLNLQNGDKWNLKSIRSSGEWLEIMKLSDDIKKMIDFQNYVSRK